MGVVEQQPGELLVHLPALLGIFVCGEADAIALLDGDEDNEVQGLQGGTDPGQPLLDVERIGVLVRQEVPEKVEGAAIKQDVSRVLFFEQLQGAAELLEEILLARRRPDTPGAPPPGLQ
uniref:hypothetical protein n=1 Tax=Corallococcus coralloides TaxID=184914 RepID=UPI0013E8A22C|nr:hypothetical protein [Corallococcus coralloides]